MNRVHNVVLLALLCLSAVAVEAQEWRGAASIAIEVKGKPVGNVDGALVIMRYQQMEPPGGPRPVLTDSAGRAVLVDLAPGVWEVEVSHDDFLSFVALVLLDGGRKPAVQASFLQASGSSLTPIRVKFLDGKGRPPSASVPLPPEAAARLAQRRPPAPPQPPTVTPEPSKTRTDRSRLPQPVVPEHELRPLPETARPAEPPTPTPPSTPAAPEPEAKQAEIAPVQRRPEAAPPPVPRPEPQMPAAPEPVPTVPEPEMVKTEPPPVADPEPAPKPELEAAPPMPEPALQPALPEPTSEPVVAEPELKPAPMMPDRTELPEPEPPPAAPAPAAPPRPEPAPSIPQPTEPPTSEPAPAMPAPAMPTEPEPTPSAPESEATTPTAEPAPPLSEPELEPAGAPTPPPAPTSVMPVPGPLGPTLRAYRDRTCVECRPGEWAISVEVIAGPAIVPCADPLDANGRELAGLLGGSIALELKEVAAPAQQAAAMMGSSEASARVAELLGVDSRSCRIVAAVIPKAGRVRGMRMEAADASGIGDCQADRPCPVGLAHWLGQPRVYREPSSNVVWGLFVNEAPDRERRARLTVYFAAPNRAWEPPR